MLTVYIADDEVWILKGLKKQIEKSGLPFKVVGEAADGLTAKKDIMRFQPDVLFTDIRMPSMDGLELLQSIYEAGLHTKVVIISGYAEFEYARRSIRYGAYEYLLKPIEPENLHEILKKLQKEIGKQGTEEETEIGATLEQKILTELKEHYTENISLSSLAEKYSVSQSGLSMMIKSKLGISFSEYITAKRMNKAKELLEDETKSITEVAEAVGYHDYYYFTKVFKKTQGISPSKYRKTK